MKFVYNKSVFEHLDAVSCLKFAYHYEKFVTDLITYFFKNRSSK